MEGKKERRRDGREGGPQSFLSLQRKGEGRKGEVEVTPTLEKSCLWGEHVSELSGFG